MASESKEDTIVININENNNIPDITSNTSFQSPEVFKEDKLCQISVVDCRHDFKQKVKVDEYIKKANIKDCDKNSQAGLSWYLYGEGFYNQYMTFIFGTINAEGCQSQDIKGNIKIENIDDEFLGQIFNIFLKVHNQIELVVDFDTIDIRTKLLKILGEKVKWVVSAQTEFDFAPLGNPDDFTKLEEDNVLYLNPPSRDKNISRNSSITFNKNNEGVTSLFFMKPYESIIMFFEKRDAYSLIIKNKKAVLIDKTYANKNGDAYDIVSKSKTLDNVMKKFKKLLFEYEPSIANNLTKFIAKRLGDQGQVISCLTNTKGNFRVFITHDSVARDFAILIGVPIVIFTKNTIIGEKGYIIYVRHDIIRKEILVELQNNATAAIEAAKKKAEEEAKKKAEEEAEKSREQLKIKEELNKKFNYILTKIDSELNNFKRKFSELSNKEQKLNEFKSMLKNIIDEVYFLKTYQSESIREKASKVLKDTPELINFKKEKVKIESIKRKWSNTDRLQNTPDIRGIISSIICFDEIKKIYDILGSIDSPLNLQTSYRKALELYQSIIEDESDTGRRLSPSYIFYVNATKLIQSITGVVRGGNGSKKPRLNSDLEAENLEAENLEEEKFNIIDEKFHLLLYMIVESISQLQGKCEIFTIYNLLNPLDDVKSEIIKKVLIIIDTLEDSQQTSASSALASSASASSASASSASASDVNMLDEIDIEFDDEPFTFPFENDSKYNKFLNILQTTLNNYHEDPNKYVKILGDFIIKYFNEISFNLEQNIDEYINSWRDIYIKFKNGDTSLTATHRPTGNDLVTYVQKPIPTPIYSARLLESVPSATVPPGSDERPVTNLSVPYRKRRINNITNPAVTSAVAPLGTPAVAPPGANLGGSRKGKNKTRKNLKIKKYSKLES